VTRKLLLLSAAIALSAAACDAIETTAEVATLETVSDEPPSVGGVPEVSSEEEAEEALLAFTECLREEGIQVEDPSVGVEGGLGIIAEGPAGEMDFEAFDAAQEVCLVHLEGVTLGFDQVDQTEFEDQLLAFATCMRDNGIDMDDPDLSGFEPGGDGEPGVIDPFGDVDPTDPAFQSALEACEEHLSGFGPPQP
jgi:hypothetical protein